MPGKDEEIKIRVPGSMKRAIKQVADGRFTSESEIAREALLEYLRSRNISLQEDSTSAAPPASNPPTEPVSYKKPRKAKSSSKAAVEEAEQKILDAIKAEAERLKQSSQPKP